MNAEFFENSFDTDIANDDLLLVRIIESECLLKRKQVLRAIVTGKRLLDRHDTGMATSVAHKYGGLEVSDAKRLKALEDENTKLKKLLVEAMLDNAMLKDVASKKW
jgi:hypothetical protein